VFVVAAVAAALLAPYAMSRHTGGIGPIGLVFNSPSGNLYRIDPATAPTPTPTSTSSVLTR
jgi:hypothetical protein